MRWQVHGIDSITGQSVVLEDNHDDAAEAVQAALHKRILVSHVRRERSVGRILVPFLSLLLAVLIPLCIAVYVQNLSIRSQLEQAVYEQSRLAQSVAQAENLATQIRQSSPNQSSTSDESAVKMRQLLEQLASVRTRMNLTEQQLNSAHEKLYSLERTANQIPTLQQQLTTTKHDLGEAEVRLSRLTSESALQRRRLKELESLPPDPALVAHARQLEQANHDLAAQVELFKSQLLANAVKAAAQSQTSADTASDFGPESARWALRVGFDAGCDLLALYFDKETYTTTSTSDGAVVTTGSRPANAATLRIVHDRKRERLYSATLTVSLATGTPRDKLAENTTLVVQFVKTLAPGYGSSESVLGTATSQLAGKDSTQRLVFMGDDYKLTLWNNRPAGSVGSSPGDGLYSFKIESPRADLDP